MKKTSQSIRWLVCGLLLGAAVYSCKSKEEPVAPETYAFTELNGITMPDLVQTAPAAVSVTAGTITSSTMAAAVSSGLNDMTTSGQTPEAVQQAGIAVGQAVSEGKAADLTSSFTPDMVSSGVLSADLKKEVASVADNDAVRAYMPSFTLPDVNNKPVGARAGSAGTGIQPVAEVKAVMQSGSLDACRQAATTAYTTVTQKLESTKASQTASVNATYSQQETAANNAVASCQAAVPATYDGLRSTLRSQLNTMLTALNAMRARLGERMYNRLALLAYVGYFKALDQVDMLQAANLKVCTATRDAQIASARVARDTDLNRITTTYNTRMTAAASARDRALASCHNQGNGG